jgi:hypothetical protein
LPSMKIRLGQVHIYQGSFISVLQYRKVNGRIFEIGWLIRTFAF